MKGKIIMLITIGIICILLSGVMFVQFKSVQVIEKSGIEGMNNAELRTEYAEVKAKSDEIQAALEETQKSIEEYKTQSTSTQGTMDLLKEDVNKANCDIGYTNVKGPGLEIIISDSDRLVSYYDLLFAINELKYAGAEAISVNDIRVVNTTFISNIQDRFLIMDGQRITSPYTIKVIGDTKYLESVINIKGGLKEYIQDNGMSISYSIKDEVHIEKYKDLIEINYGE